MEESVNDIFGVLNFLGKNSTVSDILSVLFFVCMPYGICSDPCVVLCISWVLHVVPTMPYLFDYLKILILSLVGLVVCGCNQSLRICVYNLIGGDEVFISGVDSG